MSISNLTLLNAPTISVSGGTTRTYGPDGTPITRGVQVSDISNADITTREACIFRNTNGQLQKDNTWSKDRRSAKIVSPAVLANGTQDFSYIEINLVKSPLRDANTLANLKEKAIQLLQDADVTAFWSTGSVG